MDNHTATLAQPADPIGELERFKKVFHEMMERMAEAEDHHLRTLFARMIIQLERHFEQEDQLIAHTEPPEAEAHQEEHQQLLNELYYLKERIENGLYSLGRTYVRVRLPEWYQQHLTTHDRDLSDHLQHHYNNS